MSHKSFLTFASHRSVPFVSPDFSELIVQIYAMFEFTGVNCPMKKIRSQNLNVNIQCLQLENIFYIIECWKETRVAEYV